MPGYPGKQPEFYPGSGPGLEPPLVQIGSTRPLLTRGASVDEARCYLYPLEAKQNCEINIQSTKNVIKSSIQLTQ